MPHFEAPRELYALTEEKLGAGAAKIGLWALWAIAVSAAITGIGTIGYYATTIAVKPFVFDPLVAYFQDNPVTPPQAGRFLEIS